MSLLEVLAAFVIAALAVGTVVNGGMDGLRAARIAAHTEDALSRARSRLAAAAASPVPGESAGEDGGSYRWRLSVAPVAASAGRHGPALLGLRVAVSWTMDGGTRQVVLQTERLADGTPP